MLKRGYATAYQLAKEAGISQPAAMRVLSGVALERIDVALLEALARHFRVKPWALLVHTTD